MSKAAAYPICVTLPLVCSSASLHTTIERMLEQLDRAGTRPTYVTFNTCVIQNIVCVIQNIVCVMQNVVCVIQKMKRDIKSKKPLTSLEVYGTPQSKQPLAPEK